MVALNIMMIVVLLVILLIWNILTCACKAIGRLERRVEALEIGLEEWK